MSTMPDGPSVLVVDSEATTAEMVVLALRHSGFSADSVASGRAALHAIVDHQPDLVILEVDLADLDGFTVVRRIREIDLAQSRLPVIFLSVRDEPADRAEGLRLGADDYVGKPFSPEELVERVRAVLRRSGLPTGPTPTRLAYAGVVMDTTTREVWRDDEPIELSPTEYRLLHYLLGHPRQVFTREQIIAHVWGEQYGGSSSLLDTYISYLRDRLGRSKLPLVHTVRGVGYTLREPPGASGAAAPRSVSPRS